MEKDEPRCCPYQAGKATIICVAGQLLVPSLEEQRRYCQGDFDRCPYYLTAEISKKDEKAGQT